jgi:ankyrin repeat protein
MSNNPEREKLFGEAVHALDKGNYSHLETMMQQSGVSLIDLLVAAGAPKVPMEQAFTWACMLGRTSDAEFLLGKGVDPIAGDNTGLNGFHYAAWHGHLDTVKLLLERRVPLEVRNMYGGTVLGTTLHGIQNQPTPEHVAIIELLLDAGAKVEDVPDFPTGNEKVDELLRRHGAKT